jgi:hypothetical protein
MGVTADHMRDPNFAFIRAAQTQVKIAELARARLQQRAQERAMRDLRAHKKNVPMVQRPGVSQDRGSYADRDIEALNHRIDGARTSLEGARLGAQLLKAQRFAGRR